MPRPSIYNGPMTPAERKHRFRARKYADHLGLIVRCEDGVFTLVERYGKKRVVGSYRSVRTLERGITRFLQVGEERTACQSRSV